ncbi:MAG: glycosyltransferase [Acidimicrobiales bacterium]
MRILTLIHLYPPHHVGGYEVACRGTMERLHTRGHEILVLTSDTRLPGTDEASSPNSVEVERRCKLWFDPEAFGPLSPGLGRRVAMERVNQRAVRQAIRRFRPDVASVWSLGFSSWSMLTILEDEGVPVVYTFLDDWPVYAYVFDAWTRIFDRRPWARPFGRALGLVTRLPTMRSAVANVASQMIAEQIAEHGRWKFPNAPVVPIGVDTDEIPIVEPPARAWSWRLAYVGRVVPAKGVPTLVRAMGELPAQSTLDVMGHGPDTELEAMASLAEEVGAGERVRFGRVARSEIAPRIGEADVLVFPSEWPEPFGIVPLEAMACGVPVVATGTGGSAEFLTDEENCLLYRAGDVDALAAAVRRLAEDDALRARVIAGGTQTVMRLNMDRYTDELELLHQRAADRRA